MTTDLEKEREAFEAAYAPIFVSNNVANMPRRQNGEYVAPQQQIAWMMWQARAALAAPAAPQAQPSDEEIEHIGYECGLRKRVEHWGVRYHFELGRNLFVFARALLSRYGAAPQGGEDADSVAWRHSKTLSLYETEEEVPLADGDEWAEPLCLCDRPQPAGRDAREVPDET